MDAINNFGDYAKKNDRDVDFAKLKNLKEDLDLVEEEDIPGIVNIYSCLLYTSPSPRDRQKSRMPSSA